MKAESSHTSKTKLETYEANLGSSSVRLSIDEIGSGVLSVFDGVHQFSYRLNYPTLVCLHTVLSSWDNSKDETNDK